MTSDNQPWRWPTRRSALEANPNSAGAHTEASYALAKLGRIEEAYAQIKRATELDATFPTAWDYRGELELARHDYQAAIDSLSRGLAIAPTYFALQKREQAYRQLGLTEKADEDRQTLDALTRIRVEVAWKLFREWTLRCGVDAWRA